MPNIKEVPESTWPKLIRRVKPHVVRITTTESSGTGFLLRRKGGKLWVATAAHVVRDAIAWEQVITIHHDAFKAPLDLYDHERVAVLHPRLDSAFVSGKLPALRDDSLPEKAIEHVPTEKAIAPGVEVGWLGYPYMVPGQEPCFFSGRVSIYRDRRYFIDGVAIPGVSGGPAFYYSTARKAVNILGSVTAYSPNRMSGEALPGLMVADDCTQWPGIVEDD